ncbi:MAG: ferritin-like domain-containing protein [Myxococcota bacterium]
MDKLIADHRRMLGEFELVDFVDTDEIERIRGHLQVDSPTAVHWQWEYGSEVAELRALYEKGKRNQWNATTDLDWDFPVTAADWLMEPGASLLAQACALLGKDEATQKAALFDEVGYVISQLLHGEQAALQLCGQLTNLCPTTDEKWYAANQVADEARHNEVLARFLSSKIGTIHPIGPTLKILLDTLLSVEGYEMKCLGMQTLFEGMAVGIMDTMLSVTRNPLFADILRRVQQDEARHAAFGVLTMRRCVTRASREQRERMEDWAFSVLEALNANQQLDMLRVLGPRYGINPDELLSTMHQLPNWAELNSDAYMHTVIPNLLRLGLITDRTEDRWRSIGVLTDIRKAARSELPISA